MTITAEERSFVTTAIISVAVGLIVLAVGFEILEKKSTEHKFIQSANPGDTPVVLVGGTLTIKSGAQANPPSWSPATQSTKYSLDPGYAIAKIVVKKNAPVEVDDQSQGGDDQPASDRLSVDVSDAGTWEIDAYAIAPTVGAQAKEVATLTPKKGTTEIDLNVLQNADTTAALCYVSGSTLKIGLGHTGQGASCPDNSSFDSVILKLDGKTTGALNCIDANGTTGSCRIVLRGPPPS
jgi:hypothetical protein